MALLHDIRYKCQLNLSREQPLLPALDVFGMGWVMKTHDPTYSR